MGMYTWLCCFTAGTHFSLSTLLVLVLMVTCLGEGRHQCSCLGHQFLLSCVGCPSSFCKFLNNCFTWSKKRSDHMLMSMMLNSMKKHANWYGVKVPCTTLHIKLVATYIVSSSLMSTYGICKMSMNNFICHVMIIQSIKNEFLFVNIILKMNWEGVGKTNTKCQNLVVLF